MNLYCVYQFSDAYQFRQTISCEPTFRVECLLHGDCKINSVKTDIVLIFVMKENIEGAVKTNFTEEGIIKLYFTCLQFPYSFRCV